MSIHNITQDTFDYHCEQCSNVEVGIAHARLLRWKNFSGQTVLVHVSCEQHGPDCQRAAGGFCGQGTGCQLHTESFNPNLSVEEETSPTRDEASREQVRNVRLLYKHLGLPTAQQRAMA